MSEFVDSPSAAGEDVDEDRYRALLRAALDLAGDHDLEEILGRMARCAADVAGARYAALGIYDDSGRIERFVHHGLDAATVERVGSLPEGRGLLREVIVADGPIRLSDIGADPRSCGFPAHHPTMRSFLGVPVRRGARRFGNLYVTEKRDGGDFDAEDERLVVTLAAFAAAAIESVMLAAAEERARLDRDLLTRVIDAQEAERARVSRDLHDQIGQSLTSVLLGQRLVLDALDREDPDVHDAHARAEEVRGIAAEALNEVRELAFELRPIVLDDIGLVAALRRLASDLAQRNDFVLDVDLDQLTDDTRLPGDIETVVYRVVQEALTNVARHARASRVRVSVAVAESGLRAEIVDDGAGFDPAAAHHRSLGVTGMTERAAVAGGRVEITSSPGAGTTVRLDLPVG
jgi:two-component system, NarL family, sensor histidine kinase DevS